MNLSFFLYEMFKETICINQTKKMKLIYLLTNKVNSLCIFLLEAKMSRSPIIHRSLFQQLSFSLIIVLLAPSEQNHSDFRNIRTSLF